MGLQCLLGIPSVAGYRNTDIVFDRSLIVPNIPYFIFWFDFWFAIGYESIIVWDQKLM